MTREGIAFIWRCWQATLIRAVWLGASLMFLWHVSTFGYVMVLAMVPLRIFNSWYAYGEWRPSFWRWRFSRRVVGFRAVSSGGIKLLFPPSLKGVVDFQEVIGWTKSDLDDLTQRFGVRPRCPLSIVLVPSHKDLSADFGRPMGGTMLVEANAVVLAADCVLRDGLRHELAHLFACHWNMCPPPLLEEGLAVWVQGTEQAVPIEQLAGHLLCQPESSLAPLLDRGSFFSPANLHRCYTLAGGFTGFLIQRFGWDRYRDCYRVADRRNFRSHFEKQFGMSVEWAWQLSRESLAEKAASTARPETASADDSPWRDTTTHVAS